MTRRTILATALLAAAAACMAASSSERRIEVRIKRKAVVARDVIELCDVADVGKGAPDNVRHLPLGNAPWPGSLREVSRTLIKVRLVSSGLDLDRFEFAGSDLCRVSLATLRVGPDRIVACARQLVGSFFPKGMTGLRIDLLREPTAVLVPAAGGAPLLRASVSASGPPVGNVRVDVDVMRDGTRLSRVPVSFSVRVAGRVAVAARRIAAGQRIEPTDVAFAQRDLTALRDRCFSTPEQAAGKVASRTILPGEIITGRAARDPEPPIVIEANQRVFLVVQTDTLRVVTLGKARSRAREGEIIRARNLTTGREVVGVARMGGVVEVSLGGPAHAEQD